MNIDRKFRNAEKFVKFQTGQSNDLECFGKEKTDKLKYQRHRN